MLQSLEVEVNHFLSDCGIVFAEVEVTGSASFLVANVENAAVVAEDFKAIEHIFIVKFVDCLNQIVGSACTEAVVEVEELARVEVVQLDE